MSELEQELENKLRNQLRKSRNRMLGWSSSWLLFSLLLSFVVEKFENTKILLGFFFVAASIFVFFKIGRVYYFAIKCPRCGLDYNVKGLMRKPFVRECQHCSLKIGTKNANLPT